MNPTFILGSSKCLLRVVSIIFLSILNSFSLLFSSCSTNPRQTEQNIFKLVISYLAALVTWKLFLSMQLPATKIESMGLDLPLITIFASPTEFMVIILYGKNWARAQDVRAGRLIVRPPTSAPYNLCTVGFNMNMFMFTPPPPSSHTSPP